MDSNYNMVQLNIHVTFLLSKEVGLILTLPNYILLFHTQNGDPPYFDSL